MLNTKLKEMKVIFLLGLACVVRSQTLNQGADDVGSNLEDGEEIWEGDMILTKEQAKALYGEEPESSDQTLNQRADESGLNLEDGEQIWEGDMILTKEQAKALYGEGPESSDQNRLVERHDPSDGSELREGDMRLSKDQIHALYGERSEEIEDATIGRTLWDNGVVPYKIDQSAKRIEDIILEAIRKWENVTCIKFVKHTGDWNSGNHVVFTTPYGRRCASPLGMNKNDKKKQMIDLPEGCNTVGIIMHEIGHTIGFLHEQNRVDRDNYIRVLKENVDPEYIRDVSKKYRSLHDYDEIPYDYGSLMHYGMNHASINGENTIVPHNPRHTLEIGDNEELTFTDVKLATLMYKCSAKCSYKPSCWNEGFVDKNCKCYCSKEYGGPNCKTKVPTPEPACGGTISSSTIIQTPNFPFHSPDGTKCIWEFKAPAGKNVMVEFQQLYSPTRYAGQRCTGEQVHIRGGGFNGAHTYCGNDLNRLTVYIGPHQNGTFVLYKSDNLGSGFRAYVDFV